MGHTKLVQNFILVSQNAQFGSKWGLSIRTTTGSLLVGPGLLIITTMFFYLKPIQRDFLGSILFADELERCCYTLTESGISRQDEIISVFIFINTLQRKFHI